MATAFHGTAIGFVAGLLAGKANNPIGLFVTERADLAQRYADAVASHEVSTEVRRVKSSAVIELETEEVIDWKRRADSHRTLDLCEATIKTWQIAHVTIYTTEYEIGHSVVRVDSKYIKIYPYLQERLGDRLEIVVIE